MKMVKKKRLIISVCAMFLCVSILALSSCAPKVRAYDLTRDASPISASERPSDEKFISSQMDLSLRLFKASNAETAESTLVSPLSLTLALAMTANGASGETRAQMQALLGEDIPLEDLNEYLYTYAKYLPSDDDAKLEIANSIWLRDDSSLNVRDDFLSKAASYYDAQIYKNAFDIKAMKDMNNWVRLHTDDTIEKIVDDRSAPDEITVMYLLNALAFNAEWREPYERSNVDEGIFTTDNGERQQVDMMRSEEGLYIETSNATGFYKSYKGSKYSFIALLPSEGIQINDYIATLDAQEILHALNNGTYVTVNATIPKFDYEYSLKMKDALSSLGMSDAFDVNVADFSELGTCENGNIYIDDVLHKTYIRVDERGTRAGAVTKIELGCGSADMSENKTVTLDRPFVYMIIDMESKLPIFVGALKSIE